MWRNLQLHIRFFFHFDARSENLRGLVVRTRSYSEIIFGKFQLIFWEFFSNNVSLMDITIHPKIPTCHSMFLQEFCRFLQEILQKKIKHCKEISWNLEKKITEKGNRQPFIRIKKQQIILEEILGWVLWTRKVHMNFGLCMFGSYTNYVMKNTSS